MMGDLFERVDKNVFDGVRKSREPYLMLALNKKKVTIWIYSLLYTILLNLAVLLWWTCS